MAQILNPDTTSAAARRSAFEIRMDILRVAAEGCTKPTLIMYQSNTSWIVLRKNLEALIAAGFMIESVIGSRTAYSITDKGVGVLRAYRNLVYLTSS
jgi:predicted transcriptional regulator